MEEIRIYKSPVKALRLFLFCSVLIALVSYIFNGVTNQAIHILGYSIMLLLIIFEVISLFNLFDRRPQVIISERGVQRFGHDSEVIHWEEIKRVVLIEVYKQNFLVIGVYKKYQNRFDHHLNNSLLFKLLGLYQLNIQASLLNVNENELYNLLNDLRKADGAYRQFLIANYSQKTI